MEDIMVTLNGGETNRIQPFLTISGDDSEQAVYEKFERLKDMGIYSAVLQYYGAADEQGEQDPKLAKLMQIYKFDDTYFQIIGYMVRACRALGMTFWVQDAAPFPTGSADGAFTEPENFAKGKIYLEERHTNIRGPRKGAMLLAERFCGLPRGTISQMMADLNPQGPESAQKGRLLGAVLVKYETASDGTVCFQPDSAVDVTDCINEAQGTICLDVPEGLWRLFFFFETQRGGRKYYMNLLDAESVRVQIDRVLELHYQKLKGELGKTWEGFFYDEPEVGNIGGYDFYCLPGRRLATAPEALPWSREMPEKLRERMGAGWLTCLPGLWYGFGGQSHCVRFHYMDIVTRLISENYNGQILPWCRARGIRYIGHILEDEGSHARLGCGTGHFFRTEKYQDLAGIDLIAGQILPGMDMQGMCDYAVSDGDGNFYHYGLAKLASSEYHINPDKKGSFCEVNAVYGDLTNAKFFKFLLDHLFVNGITQLVPVITEALDTREGKCLWDYANRMCLLLEGNVHVAQVAILYHAESEWAGDFQPFHVPGRELLRRQIDYDVIPGDVLVEQEFYRTQTKGGVLSVNGHAYRALVIPYCRYIRKDVFGAVLKAVRNGVPVYFVDGLPEGYCETDEALDWQGCQAYLTALTGLAEQLIADGIAEVCCATEEPYLRLAHWQKDGIDYYMVFNEEPEREITETLVFSTDREGICYDVMNQKLYQLSAVVKDGKTFVPVELGQYESRLFLFRNGIMQKESQVLHRIGKKEMLAPGWTVTLYPGLPEEREIVLQELTDLGTMDGMEHYTETLRYRTCFTANEGELGEGVMLDLGKVCDSAEVILNGKELGLRIASPYRYDISEAVREGENELQIVVRPSPARRRNRGQATAEQILSAVTYAVMPQVGLLGPVGYIGVTENSADL